MARILVSGTAGFIGFHLVTRLIAEGGEVFGIDSIDGYYDPELKLNRLRKHGIESPDTQTITKSNKYENYRFARIELEDDKSLNQVFKDWKPEIVVNLAAQAGVRYSLKNPQAYIQSNIIGFTNILECCRHHEIKHLVYASSSSVYGLNTKVPFSTSHNVDHPISLYAASKKSNELMAHTYSHLFKLPTTGLRFFTVYGPWGRPDMALFLFTKAILSDEPIQVFNYGKMQRDFTYIDDIIEGVTRILRKPAKSDPMWKNDAPNPSSSIADYRVYNIGNNNPVQLMDFIEAIEKKLGKTAKKDMMPIQPGDVPSTYADVDALVRDFDYKPQTSIQEGIDKFIDWYLSYYSIK
ncbi:MAG: NAD-dependent epimerase [Bacteroidota bacterium]